MATTPENHVSNWLEYVRRAEEHTIVPDQERVLSQRHKSLTDSRGESVREEVDTHNQTTHVLRRFAVSELKGRDTGTDFGKGNQAVRQGLHPDIDRSRAVDCFAGLVLPSTLVDVVPWASRHFVDVGLQHASGHHGHGGDEDTHCDTLERREVDVSLAEAGVNDVVEDWNEDDQAVKIVSIAKKRMDHSEHIRDRVQVVDQIVGSAVQLQSCRLRREITDHLVVSEPVEPSNPLASRIPVGLEQKRLTATKRRPCKH